MSRNFYGRDTNQEWGQGKQRDEKKGSQKYQFWRVRYFCGWAEAESPWLEKQDEAATPPVFLKPNLPQLHVSSHWGLLFSPFPLLLFFPFLWRKKKREEGQSWCCFPKVFPLGPLLQHQISFETAMWETQFLGSLPKWKRKKNNKKMK